MMLLHTEQRALLWASVKRVLREEAAKLEAPDTAHALAEQMAASAASEAPGTHELAALLLELYLKAVRIPGSTGRGEQVLQTDGLCGIENVQAAWQDGSLNILERCLAIEPWHSLSRSHQIYSEASNSLAAA